MSQSQRSWCRLDVSSSSGCVISPSLPSPVIVTVCVCVSSCLRNLPSVSSDVLLFIGSSWHIAIDTFDQPRKKKKGAAALLCTHHNCLRKCSLTLSVHLSLGCSRTHRPSSCLPEWSEVLSASRVFTGALFFCFFSLSLYLSVVPSYCTCDPIALQLWDLGHISCVCYNTCLHHFIFFCPPW